LRLAGARSTARGHRQPSSAAPITPHLSVTQSSQMVRIMADSSSPEAAQALREEWQGPAFRENMFHAAKVTSTFNGTDFGKKLEEAGLLDHPQLWQQTAKFGRALAEDAAPKSNPPAMPAAKLKVMAELEAMQVEERDRFGKPEFADKLFQSRRDRVYRSAIEAGII
jgi:hypothetical protein